MDPGGSDGLGQAGIGADEKTDATAPAEVGEPASQDAAVGILVVAKDDRRTAGQGSNGGDRVGQSRAVGHQDEARHQADATAADQIEPPCQVC